MASDEPDVAPFMAQEANGQRSVPPRACLSLTAHGPRGHQLIEAKRALDLGMHGPGSRGGSEGGRVGEG